MRQENPDRRQFLKAAGSAALTSATVAGNIRGANDRVNLGFIGVGRMGTGNIGFAAQVPGFEIVSLCDVYQPTLDAAVKKAKGLGYTGVKAQRDFREVLADKSIDAVSIATPDHWHAYMAIEALKAGKDVWVERPACVYVEEGIRMIQAARRYGSVVEGGAFERSGTLFRQARTILQRGDLGDITFCDAFHTRPPTIRGYGNPPDSDPPPGLDWDMWLGPAPRRPFNANRWSAFRCFWDYAGGAMTDWGVHLLDVVQFAFDETMPVRVEAQGGKFYVTDNTETPDTMLATYRYPGFIGSCRSRTANPYPACGDICGTAFHGTEATLMVNRAGYAIYPNKKGAAQKVERNSEWEDINVLHWKDFQESIRLRHKPAGDIESCVRSTTTCLLANLALRHNMALDWDAGAWTVKQAEVRPFLKAQYRAPWKLEV